MEHYLKSSHTTYALKRYLAVLLIPVTGRQDHIAALDFGKLLQP